MSRADEGLTLEQMSSVAEQSGQEGRPATRGEPSPPRDRAILWVPVKLGLTGTRVTPAHDLYIAQEPLREIQDQVAFAREEEVAGILVGRVDTSPEAGRPYAVATGVRKADRALPEEAEVDEALRLLEPLCRAAAEEGEKVVGWYHGHSLLGAFLSERDAGVHLRRFPEPWQFAVVGVGDSEQPVGGVFGRTEWGALLRGVRLPFHELLEEASLLEDGRKATWLRWHNYRTEEVVVPAEKAGLAAPRPRSDAPRRAVEEGREIPAGNGGGRSETPAPTAPPARVSPRKGPAATPPSAGGDRPGPTAPVAAKGGGGPKRPSEDGPEAERGLAVILPGELPAERARQWRRRARRVGGALVAAVLLGAGWMVWKGLSGPPSPPPAAPGAAAVPAAAFGGLSTLLAEAAGAYRQRAAAFDGGRVGCDELRPAYREVDAAFLALSERYVQVREELREAGAAAYQAAARTAEQVDRHFDASGCPRPE